MEDGGGESGKLGQKIQYFFQAYSQANLREVILNAAFKIQKNSSKMTKKKNLEITSSDYKKLLTKIQKQIAQTQSKIIKTVTRQKVEMAWQIGKLVDEHLSQNSESSYGKHLFKRLEKDVGVAERSLYQMHHFYQSYPQLPADNDRLNWSHYRTLAGIKKADERKYLEDLTKKNEWDSDRLQEEVTKSKISEPEQDSMQDGVCNPVLTFSSKTNKSTNVRTGLQTPSGARSGAASVKPKKLIPSRGKLFSYPIATLPESKSLFFDCGFEIFKEVDLALSREVKKENAIVAIEKKNQKYSAKKSAIHPKKLYVYKAKLDRVVDGDTIRVVLDLGFKIFHKEILRLRGIDAAEMKSDAGANSKKTLEKILKDVPFLIVKTTRVDIYGRYVADVFLAGEGDSDLQKVADSGVFLNQLLLDKGSAEIWKSV